MRPLILVGFCLFCFLQPLHAAEEHSGVQTKSEAAGIQIKLERFEKGALTLDDLTSESEELCKSIVLYFDTTTNNISTKAKLVVARCFAIEHDFPRAAKLSEEYIAFYTNDARGWRILGGANAMQRKYNDAIHAYTNAVRLGDELCYSPLAGMALVADRLDIMRSIVPHLLELRFSQDLPIDNRLEIVMAIASYSERTGDVRLLERDLEGFSIEDLDGREDVLRFIAIACNELKPKKSEKLCGQVRKVMDERGIKLDEDASPKK